MTPLPILHQMFKGAIALTIVLFAQCALADMGDDQRYNAERQHNVLLDQENLLLREEGRLKQDVDQLKREVAARLEKIDIAQRRLDRINHNLITLRMKFLP